MRFIEAAIFVRRVRRHLSSEQLGELKEHLAEFPSGWRRRARVRRRAQAPLGRHRDAASAAVCALSTTGKYSKEEIWLLTVYAKNEKEERHIAAHESRKIKERFERGPR